MSKWVWVGDWVSQWGCRWVIGCGWVRVRVKESVKKTRKYIVSGLPGRGSGDHGTPGRISDPRKLGLWQCTFIHVCYVKQVATQGGQGRVYIQPLNNIYCAPPARQKKRNSRERQVIPPTPGQCTLSRANHVKKTGNPKARHTSNPLLIYFVICLSHKRAGNRRNARIYIRPASHNNKHCPTSIT